MQSFLFTVKNGRRSIREDQVVTTHPWGVSIISEHRSVDKPYTRVETIPWHQIIALHVEREITPF